MRCLVGSAPLMTVTPAVRAEPMSKQATPIVDLDDPRLAVYRHLKSTNETRDSGQFVVEGDKLFERLLDSDFPLASVLVSDRAGPLGLERVPDDVPVYLVPHERMELLVGFNFHRGVLASGLRKPWPKLDDVVNSAGDRTTLVVCPRIDNPENLGGILRIADVFGVLAVVTGARCPDPLSRRVLRVSMGSSLCVPVVAPEDLKSALLRLQNEHRFRLTATVLDPTAAPLEQFRRADRVAVLLGSEGTGLDQEWVNLCDDLLTIPMRAGAESLNVAVAAGIILYHLTRRG